VLRGRRDLDRGGRRRKTPEGAGPLIDEANSRIRSWLDRPGTDFLVTHETDVVQAMRWLEAAGSGGNLTTDAQIAAVAHRYRATVHTADTDFGRFPDVRWVNPILTG
jgi:predicted nucleic acid-binding protein